MYKALRSVILLASFSRVLFSEDEKFLISIPSIFSSGMVLQQEKPIRVWGHATPLNSVEIEFAGERKKAFFNGDQWFVEFSPQKALGETFSMKIYHQDKLVRSIDEIQIGEVWLASGQSNMQMRLDMTKEGDAAMERRPDPYLRCYRLSRRFFGENVPKVPDTWQSASPQEIETWSAVGYHFAYNLRQALKVPVAFIDCAMGASSTESWCREELIQKIPDSNELHFVKRKEDAKLMLQHKPSNCFNQMLSKVIPYSVRGVIWYQGETNTPAADQQEKLFTAMVSDWRVLLKDPQLPFYFVQLARFQQEDWHRFRDVQRKLSETTPNSFMVVTIDLSRESALSKPHKDPGNEFHPIHPATKRPIGDRLALAAKKLVYKIENGNGEYSGPKIRTASIKEDKVVLNFDYLGEGLKTNDHQPLRGFYIADENEQFIKADAKISKNQVYLEFQKGMRPKQVRYGAEADMGIKELDLNLVNSDGLPASPFTLDIK